MGSRGPQLIAERPDRLAPKSVIAMARKGERLGAKRLNALPPETAVRLRAKCGNGMGRSTQSLCCLLPEHVTARPEGEYARHRARSATVRPFSSARRDSSLAPRRPSEKLGRQGPDLDGLGEVQDHRREVEGHVAAVIADAPSCRGVVIIAVRLGLAAMVLGCVEREVEIRGRARVRLRGLHSLRCEPRELVVDHENEVSSPAEQNIGRGFGASARSERPARRKVLLDQLRKLYRSKTIVITSRFPPSRPRTLRCAWAAKRGCGILVECTRRRDLKGLIVHELDGSGRPGEAAHSYDAIGRAEVIPKHLDPARPQLRPLPCAGTLAKRGQIGLLGESGKSHGVASSIQHIRL